MQSLLEKTLSDALSAANYYDGPSRERARYLIKKALATLKRGPDVERLRVQVRLWMSLRDQEGQLKSRLECAYASRDVTATTLTQFHAERVRLESEVAEAERRVRAIEEELQHEEDLIAADEEESDAQAKEDEETDRQIDDDKMIRLLEAP